MGEGNAGDIAPSAGPRATKAASAIEPVGERTAARRAPVARVSAPTPGTVSDVTKFPASASGTQAALANALDDKEADASPPPWAVIAEAIPASAASHQTKHSKNTKTVATHPADASTRSMRVIEWLTSALRDPWRERIREYLVLMRMDRPVGALLLLWPTLWGLWFAANDFPPIGTLIIFTLGVFVMRAAGCVINDYADHAWLDANVERTRNRPMAAGRVSKKEALLLFGSLIAFAFVLVLLTNPLTIKLSFAGAALASIYPFCKRYTHLAQVVLGAAFGWSIPMAFAAVSGEVPTLGWLLFLANVLFSTIYDTEYAMVDREDDIRVGAKSTAILFADADRPIIGILMLTFLFALLLAGTRAQLIWPYFAGLGIAAALFARQQWLIRSRERDACFAAFRNNNWVGFVMWVGLVLALAIR
jgi:4-hydroxybenzoate polyprenyltransferase